MPDVPPTTIAFLPVSVAATGAHDSAALDMLARPHRACAATPLTPMQMLLMQRSDLEISIRADLPRT